MKPSQQKIFREDWLNFHSYTNSASSDLYYIKLCNKVYNIIDASVANSENQTLIINDEDIKKLSCILTCYFEDIISGTGIWNIFININKEKTGKILPFYDCSDYYEDEINKNDLKFLCWHFFTRLYENFYCYSPEDKTMGMIADEVYNLFDGEFEDAPENEKSKKDLSFSPEYFDIMEFIPMLSWLGIRSFILADNNDVLDKEIDYLVEYLEENDMSDYASEYVTDHIVVFPINNVTSFYDLLTP